MMVLSRRTLFKLTFWCVCFGTFMPFGLCAQDFKEALLKMKHHYADSPNLHIVMSIQGYENKSSATVFYQQKVEVKKEGRNYFYALDESEMLLNQTFLLLVNHKLKQISLRENSTGETKVEALPSFNLDSMLHVFGKVSYLGKDNGVDQFQVVHKTGGSIKQTELFFQSSSGLLQQIAYEYVNGQYISIRFDLFDSNPEFTTDTFSEKKYIRSDDGKISMATPFRGYRLIMGSELKR